MPRSWVRPLTARSCSPAARAGFPLTPASPTRGNNALATAVPGACLIAARGATLAEDRQERRGCSASQSTTDERACFPFLPPVRGEACLTSPIRTTQRMPSPSPRHRAGESATSGWWLRYCSSAPSRPPHGTTATARCHPRQYSLECRRSPKRGNYSSKYLVNDERPVELAGCHAAFALVPLHFVGGGSLRCSRASTELPSSPSARKGNLGLLT